MHIFRNSILKIFTLIFISLLIYLTQISFLQEAAKWGMNGWDDWGMLFYYDVRRGSELGNVPIIINNAGTPYIWTEVLYIGSIKTMFGLNQTIFKHLDLLWKSLAALSAAYLIFKLTKDKLFAFLVIFFFIIFPSTAGVLSHVVLGTGYLSIAFICFSALFYIQSVKNPKKIWLASLFFYLSLLACPPRAYLFTPVPFAIELVRLKRRFRPFLFMQRLLIFYLVPYLTLQGNPGWFDPVHQLFVRLKQLTSGNLYTLTLPFQMISSLVIDLNILKDFLNSVGANAKSTFPDLYGLLAINVVLLFGSLFLGFVIRKEKMIAFALKVMIPTLLLEVIFYLFGLVSLDASLRIPFVNLQGTPYLFETLDPTFYQASLGGYVFILGIVLGFEWWKHQKDDYILKITIFSWLWAVSSIFILYFTNYRYEMVLESNDKYVLANSLGAVIFTAGIFTLSFRSLAKIKIASIRLLSVSLLGIIVLFIVWKDYKLLDKFYYNWNEGEGGSGYWQDTMYRRFLEKIGKDNLKKPILLYIDSNGKIFNTGSFANTIRYRIYYDENGNLIRDNCKKIVHNDIEILKQAYEIRNGEKGFIYDTECVAPEISTIGRTVFYPLSNFYAYKMENRDFVDIKDKIINELDQ